MKICACICELNPAHNGHKYIFEKARELSDADYLIAIMSGNFVQRGEPALLDKYTRTKMALKMGADAVFELPSLFACGSAQYFARGSVAIADALNADYLIFGSETGNTELIKNNEVNLPNDILAAEYIKAVDYFNSNIKCISVKREGPGYNDDAFSTSNLASASFLRKNWKDKSSYSHLIPSELISVINSPDSDTPLSFNDLDDIIYHSIMINKDSGLSYYFDIYDDLSDKIIKNIQSYSDAESFCHLLKSKDIAFSHIKRALLHIILGQTKDMVTYASQNDYVTYIRLLGFKKESEALFSYLKKNMSHPIISKAADAHKILKDETYKIFTNDLNASDLCDYLRHSKYGTKRIPDISRNIIII